MDTEIQALIAQLADPQYAARSLATKRLVRHGLSAAPALREALESPNPIVVARAAQVLGEIGDLAAFESLKPLLSGTDTDVSSAAARALEKLACKQDSAAAQERMLAELRALRRTRRPRATTPPASTPSPSVPPTRAGTSQSHRIAALGLPDSIPALVGMLGHADYAFRQAATDALAERGVEAVPALCEALQSRSPVVRQRAAEALDVIGVQASLGPLADLLRREGESLSPETNVTDAVRGALAGLAPHLRRWPLTVAESIALVRLHAVQNYVGVPTGFSVIGAERLAVLATEHPTPELRVALAYLRGRWPLVPRAFVQARNAIEKATKAWADLPLPTDTTDPPSKDLPRPAGEDR
jgi:hypothetical protein